MIKLPNFRPHEFVNYEKMKESILVIVQEIRNKLNCPIIIIGSNEQTGHSKNSPHYKNYALDLVIKPKLHSGSSLKDNSFFPHFISWFEYKLAEIGIYKLLRRGYYKNFNRKGSIPSVHIDVAHLYEPKEYNLCKWIATEKNENGWIYRYHNIEQYIGDTL